MHDLFDQFQYDWDLAINWVLCHIDGVTNARQISKIAEVDMEMVRACLRVLKHHGFVALIDMFFFENRYETVSSATQVLLQPDSKLLSEAVAFCLRAGSSGSQENSPSNHPVGSPSNDSNRSFLGGSFRMNLATSTTTSNSDAMLQKVQRREDYLKIRGAIAELYNACTRTESIGELWMAIMARQKLRHVPLNWRKLFSLIDHRRFATFGIVHGLIRRVHGYPLYRTGIHDSKPEPSLLASSSFETPPPPIPAYFGHDRLLFARHSSADSRHSERLLSPKKVAKFMDGNHCDDAVACEFGKPLDELIELVGKEKVITLYATPKQKL